MKALLISAFTSYEPRLLLVEDVLQQLGYDTELLLTDFNHAKKTLRETSPNGATLIPTKPYRKNLSFARILSHRDFAKKALRIVRERKPEVIYAIVPPNTLARELATYKKSTPNVKLILDVCDMWPEAFPVATLKPVLAPFFFFWKALRDKALPSADLVITECDLFREKLLPISAKTIRWTVAGLPKSETPFGDSLKETLSSTELHLAYLGSINNLIDIPRIAEFVKEASTVKPVTVHVIGTGEKKEEFLSTLRDAGAKVIDYGVVYDEKKKAEIFSHCHAGLNVMKPSTFVGLSMKSLEYLKFGLPLVNSLRGDTARFVSENGVGININNPEAAKHLASMTLEENEAMRARAKDLFTSTLEVGKIKTTITMIFNEILARGGQEPL